MRGEVHDELLGDPAGAERDGVDPVDGRLEVEADGELDRRSPGRNRPLVQPTRLPVRPRPVRTEPGEHLTRREGGEGTEGAYSEPFQQIDQR